MNTLVLARDEMRCITNPTLRQIIEEMELAKREDGPPELAIEFGPRVQGQPVLSLMVLFDQGGTTPQWNVCFGSYRGQTSQCLVTSLPTKDVFVRRTRCGCVENILKECVLEDESIVVSAVEWFVKEGTCNPSLSWLDSAACIRSN